MDKSVPFAEREHVKQLLEQGIYDQNEIFRRLYPLYRGHYGRLRDLISEVKNA